MERQEGQRWGIYMTGAVGYGELSWINSLFTLAGRLLSEAGDVGASGDPALCYGERGACKCGPKSLVGMSPGTIPWFPTTVASIIIRGRPSPDAIVKPRRREPTSPTLDLFQSNNGKLGRSYLSQCCTDKNTIFYISFKHGHRSFKEHSRTRTSKPLIRWHLTSHKGRIFHANPSIICITHVLILWKIEQLFWCKPATWESPVLYRWQLL